MDTTRLFMTHVGQVSCESQSLELNERSIPTMRRSMRFLMWSPRQRPVVRRSARFGWVADDVRVKVEWRKDTIIVNFVGPSGSSKDSVLQQEIEAAPGVGDTRVCGGAYLVRAWAQPYRMGWEGLLLGVLIEQVGTTGVALDPAESHIQSELDLWERVRDWDDVSESDLNATECQDANGVILKRNATPLSDQLEGLDQLVIERSGSRP